MIFLVMEKNQDRPFLDIIWTAHKTQPLGGMFDYATDYSILIQLCILCNIVYMRDIKVFGVLFCWKVTTHTFRTGLHLPTL